MDRVITYPMAGVSDSDVLNGQKNAMLAIGAALQAILGAGPWFDGLACTPGSGLNVNLAPGSVFQQLVTDATGYGSLGADALYTTKGGLVRTTTSFAVPAPTMAGQSIAYLIEGQYQDVDGGTTLLPYYDSSNPAIPYSGPANDGIPQTTVRQAVCALQIKAGMAATTGTQTAPAADAGWTGLWVVTVAYGATSINTGNIALAAGAPFITLKLPQIPPYLINLVQSFNGRTGTITLTQADVDTALGYTPANKAGDTFTGPVSGPTPSAGDNSTKLATTAWVDASFAPLASPALTGAPTAPTQTAGDNTTKIATDAFVQAAVAAAIAALPASTSGGATSITLPGTGSANGTVGSEGWRKDASGLITQWAYIQLEDTAGASPATWTFPIAFASGPLGFSALNCAIAAGQTAGNSRNAVCNLAAVSGTSAAFTLFQTNSVGTLATFYVEVTGF